MPISVLVVERDALTRETIVYMLDALKYAAVGVESAELAYDVLDAVQLNVLIVSLAVDDPNGIDIAAHAKACQRDVKVIVVSGRNLPERPGFVVDAYVQKPFSLVQIGDAISSVLAKADADSFAPGQLTL